MTTRTIQNIDYFKIMDEVTKDIYYGRDQEWYKTKWQRLSGCGPTVVSNIIYYLNCITSDNKAEGSITTKDESISHMEEIWRYVTPTMQGIPNTSLLCKGIQKYIKEQNVKLELEVLDIPKKRTQRPEFGKVFEFIDRALNSDSPVAFLNLHNGSEKLLDSWHWVTIVSLEYENDGSFAWIEILDEGKIKKINLAGWYQTTSLGGGFVRFIRMKYPIKGLI
ncbi:MAG: hypothetical protein K0S47_1255 [Herbinix sp.]|jgi:hypothetical protein|nr:hypothetical protein [Herbinix sp.]